jgi:two-component system sensor kinase FixL
VLRFTKKIREGELRLINQSTIPLETLPGGVFYAGEDITRFREVEKTRKTRENRTKAMLDTSAEGIISINVEGTIENFNPAAAHIFGYTTSEVIGRNVKMLMPEPDQSRHDTYIDNYLRTFEPKIIGRGREVMGRRKDGTVFPLHLSVSAVQHEGKFLFTGIIRDLTEFKLMQDEVAKAKHLALVGEMAATIAHEIRNPLAGISGALQIIRGGMSTEDPQREIMEEVEQQVDRLSKSVNDLLMFTKPWNPVLDHTVLADLIAKVSRTAAMEDSFRNMHFDFRVPADLRAFLDPLLVEQILWNLFQNARDACKGDGTITITAEKEEDRVTLIVADNGGGMASETLDQIFKPFFTTKTKGTGLGLPVSKRIMEAHGGDIQAFSEKGQGSRFVLHFE